MKIFIVLLGVLISWNANAQATRCEYVEHILLKQRGLSEGDACHQQYQDCLNRPNRAQDPIRKSRCMETIRCGAVFWSPTPYFLEQGSALGFFKQECEPA